MTNVRISFYLLMAINAFSVAHSAHLLSVFGEKAT